MPRKNRNYRKEYDEFHGTARQKKRRAQRNTARAKAVKAGRVKKGDGKEVHHPTGNTASKKTKILSKRSNRKIQPKRKGRKK